MFGELSPKQLSIIKNSEHRYITVAAGPGSGKTRVLVHKLAALMLMEDIKSEQLLMLTFARAAATEFKLRLRKLVGNAARYVEIKTFHSYCFDLLGKPGELAEAESVLQEATQKIRAGAVEPGRIAKAILVVDEAQDMSQKEFELVQALMEHNGAMRIIAVGDDDQNIFEFRGANSDYFAQIGRLSGAERYELLENYRSCSNLVEFANQWAQSIKHRLKTLPIVAQRQEQSSIKIVRYDTPRLIVPLTNDLQNTELQGSTAVLTRTNDQANTIGNMLRNRGYRVKIIQETDRGFNLYNLLEIRYFNKHLNLSPESPLIDEDDWALARAKLFSDFKKSIQLPFIQSIIKKFEALCPKRKFWSEWRAFLEESRLEDFMESGRGHILVSTMHKAKGKEFDRVFLLLEGFYPKQEADKRLLYVAMTRAKSHLNIHLNGNFLEHIRVAGLQKERDPKPYPEPECRVESLGMSDIHLNFCAGRQETISQLLPGDDLTVCESGCKFNNLEVLRYSDLFSKKLNELFAKGYALHSARVHFILYWKKSRSDVEFRIVLPELRLTKKQP